MMTLRTLGFRYLCLLSIGTSAFACDSERFSSAGSDAGSEVTDNASVDTTDSEDSDGTTAAVDDANLVDGAVQGLDSGRSDDDLPDDDAVVDDTEGTGESSSDDGTTDEGSTTAPDSGSDLTQPTEDPGPSGDAAVDDTTLSAGSDAGDAGTESTNPTEPSTQEAGVEPVEAGDRSDGGRVERDGGRPPAVLTLPQLLEAYEDEDISLGELTSAVAELTGAAAEVLEQGFTGPIVLAAGVYPVGSVLVPEGSTLVLAPGAQLVLQEGAELGVEGQLYLLGDAENPTAIAGEGAGFASIRLRGTRSELHNCKLVGGSVLVRVESTGDELIEIDRCQLDEWRDSEAAGIVADGANNLWVHDSTFALQTPEGDVVGQGIAAINSLLLLERNQFGYWSSLEDSIALSGCEQGQRSHVLHNDFMGGGDDAIDCDGCDIVVDGNTIHDFTRTSSGCLTMGEDTNGLVTNNLFENCTTAVDVTGTAQGLVLNNTIVSALTGIGTDNDARLRLLGNIFWANDIDLELQSNSGPDIRHNLIDSGEATDESNFLEDPEFTGSDDAPYSLGAGSPALAHDYADADALVQGMAFPVHEVNNALGHDVTGAPRQVPVLDYGAYERP